MIQIVKETSEARLARSFGRAAELIDEDIGVKIAMSRQLLTWIDCLYNKRDEMYKDRHDLADEHALTAIDKVDNLLHSISNITPFIRAFAHENKDAIVRKHREAVGEVFLRAAECRHNIVLTCETGVVQSYFLKNTECAHRPDLDGTMSPGRHLIDTTEMLRFQAERNIKLLVQQHAEARHMVENVFDITGSHADQVEDAKTVTKYVMNYSDACGVEIGNARSFAAYTKTLKPFA